MSPEYLVKKILLGNGVLVGEVKYTGQRHAIGFYAHPEKAMGIDSGIVLTSGHVQLVHGPNKSPRSGWAANAPGDDDLDGIARGKTYDAAVLEFDFVTASENLTFRYVFASEEYQEYVGSKFNDVFGFFLTGPNADKVNLARLPDERTPITVNTVNNERNSKYYIDNTYFNTTDPFIWDVRNRKVVKNKHYMEEEHIPPYDTQFDGFSTVLEVTYKVVPNEVYHIKIAIADVADGILDSGVFLEGGSFRSSGDQIVRLDDHFQNIQVSEVPEVPEMITVPLQEVQPLAVEESIHMGIVHFDFDRYDLNEQAIKEIKRIVWAWKKTPSANIQIAGHTDAKGSNSYNEKLSERRSSRVAAALMELGVPQEQLRIVYYGEESPVSPNNSDEGRARNRRVICTILL
jgi:outer membrane protein OmpA-like peptidoglycan-associated protein